MRYPASHLPHLNHDRLKVTKPLMESDLRTRAKILNLRLLTGATASIAVVAFNSEQPHEGELVPEVNDKGRAEWTEVWRRPGAPPSGIGKRKDLQGGHAEDIGADVYFGEEALNVPNFSYPPTRPLPVGAPVYQLRSPFKNGMPNTADYPDRESWLTDIEAIWGWAAEQAGVKRTERHKWKVVLILPDHWERGAWSVVNSVLGNLRFKAISVLQESVAATFGSSFPQCVVDMGEGKTSVAVVDDGYIVPDSKWGIERELSYPKKRRLTFSFSQDGCSLRFIGRELAPAPSPFAGLRSIPPRHNPFAPLGPHDPRRNQRAKVPCRCLGSWRDDADHPVREPRARGQHAKVGR